MRALNGLWTQLGAKTILEGRETYWLYQQQGIYLFKYTWDMSSWNESDAFELGGAKKRKYKYEQSAEINRH